MSSRRSIRRDPRYERELAQIASEHPRAEEYQRGLELALSQMAERGNSVRGAPYLVWPLHIGPHRFAVYYTYDDVSVTLISVWKVPEERNWLG
ncbi:MAG: hypothetical protein KDD47_21365 [Acidobacteria bacterium]|nr:hypothetical protein [Acidobacteriota bacterium]